MKAFIVTQGAEGSSSLRMRQSDSDPEREARKQYSILRAAATPIAQGCCTASQQAYDWPTTGRLASLLGAMKIASRGGQNHLATRDEIGDSLPGSVWNFDLVK